MEQKKVCNKEYKAQALRKKTKEQAKEISRLKEINKILAGASEKKIKLSVRSW